MDDHSHSVDYHIFFRKMVPEDGRLLVYYDTQSRMDTYFLKNHGFVPLDIKTIG